MRCRVASYALAATCLLLAHPAAAASFQAGSLIIPTDECYQAGQGNAAPWAPSGAVASVREGWDANGSACSWWDANANPSTATDPFYGTCFATQTASYGGSSTGLQHAFGVLYLLAKNNIPVYVINRGNKQALGDYDFAISPSDSGNPVYYLRWVSPSYQTRTLASTGGSPIYYRGVPFVIDAAFAQQAIQVLTASNTANSIFSDVTIHVARADFDAPVTSVIATTPKPVGIISYSNSSGYNVALKYLTDAGIIYAITGSTATSSGEGSAYTTISLNKQGNLSYTWTGAPAAASCNNGRCGYLTYMLSGVKTDILDVVWAPDINQGTCQDVQPNPSCFDSDGLCNADSCSGPSAWCCPAGNNPPAYPATFNYTNPDGTITPYYCPCPQAGTSGASDLCTISGYKYDASVSSACIANLGSGNNGCTNQQFCDYTAQQCLTKCSNDNNCSAGYRCVNVSTGPSGCTSSNCPSGYGCNSGTCTSTQKVCVRQANGQNPSTNPQCTQSCASSEYCDPTDNTCKPRWGCEVTCTSCPGGNGGKLSTTWTNLASATGGLNDFLAAGGTLLGTDTSALTAEASQNYITTTGLGSTSSGSATGALFCASAVTNSPSTAAIAGFTSATPQYPASNLNLTIGDYLYRTLGGNSPVYTASTFRNTRVNAIAYLAGGVWGYPVLTGPPGTCTTTTSALGSCTSCTYGSATCQIDPTTCPTPGLTCGKVVYEGANNYASSANSAPLVKVAGQHIVYDTLLDGSSGDGTSYGIELARSAAIQNPNPILSGGFYIGSFDWRYTRPAAGSGITNWSPTAGAYPYTTGHFRQYRPQSSDTVGFTSFDWDVDTYLQGGGTPPARNIYFGVPNTTGGGYTLTAFTSGNATAVARAMYGISGAPTAAQLAVANGVIGKVTNNHRLGGIDYSTPAIIEAPHGVVSGNAALRPTIAYFGASDGMLHAVCVSAKGATDISTTASAGTCYGKQAGAEIWAIIPPAVLKQMATAYSTNDWSSINVGGSIRVADVFDYLTPGSTSQKVWKTLLLLGTRRLAAVDAFDISNPDIANLNGADFRLLWEANSSNTSPPMGQTLGATIATPSTTGVGIVTSAASTSSTGGVTTYMLRLYDGAVISSTTVSYSRTLPLIGGPLPTAAPPLATIFSSTNDTDDTAYITDAQGDIVKLTLSTTGFTGTTSLFNASANLGCSSACQPFGASVSIAKREGGNPTTVLLAATGGTDWVDTASTARYYLYGVDPSQGGALFGRSLGTLTVPTSSGTRVAPLRTYAQVTVIGTDSFIDGTVLSLGNIQQLLYPVLYNGVFGEPVRFNIGATPSDAVVSLANYIVPGAGSTYGGGLGATTFTNGTAVTLGGSGVFQHKLTTTELATSAANSQYKIGSSQSKTFKVLSWFQLGE